jgi:hypothetical protein
MPNWVYNTLTVSAPQSTLDALAVTLATPRDGAPELTELSFLNVIPRPEPESDNWYDWNIENWGTKWDARDVETSHTPGRLSYYFHTAWAPPFPVALKLASAHPDAVVRLEYEEEQGWGGMIEAAGNVIVDESAYDMPESHADVVALGRECGCDDETQMFDDCWQFQATAAGSDADTVAAVRAIAGDWEGTLPELIDVAETL